MRAHKTGKKWFLFQAAAFFVIFLSMTVFGRGRSVVSSTGTPALASELSATGTPAATEGTLRAVNDKGEVTLELPLKHTAVSAEISSFLAQVEVKQYFQNPLKDPIEAIYVFPLPENSAVNEMIMVVGTRNIYGEIHKRKEARQIYETARAAGQRTALLEQERPNIFTQSVANIQPGEEIIITIRYVQSLKYDRGVYSYVFPMVVGPRFIPGAPTGKEGTGWSPDTTTVPDASRITPPVLLPGRRSGHDISLTVRLNAGLPVEDLQSTSHNVDITTENGSTKIISIRQEDSIPNKDFILEYRIAGEKPRVAYQTHYSQAGGYLLLMMQPSLADVTTNIDKKEIFFVVDCSGSMSGYPIQKVKEAMYHCILGLTSDDTFQIVLYASSARTFSNTPIPATEVRKAEALDYINALSGSGGTMIMEGVNICLDYPRTEDRKRIIFFMTDGFVGNEDQVLAAIKERIGDAKIFSFGIGSSPNRALLDGMAELGHGTAQYIRQDQDAQPVIKDMLARVSSPYLTEVEVNWGSLGVVDVYPKPYPDLFSAQPLVLFARYNRGGSSTVTIKGKVNGNTPYQENINVSLPEQNSDNFSLAFVWAREKIKNLMFEQLAGRMPQIEGQVTDLALSYNLMSQYTSFVAVDEIIPPGGRTTLPIQISIPVPMPEGVSFTGVFGPPAGIQGDYVTGVSQEMRQLSTAMRGGGFGGGMGGAGGGGMMGGGGRGGRGAAAPSISARPTLSYDAARFGTTNAPVGINYEIMAEKDKQVVKREEETSSFIQNAFTGLSNEERNTVNQIYRGAQISETSANQTIGKLLNSTDVNNIAIGLNLMTFVDAQKVKVNAEYVTKAEKLVLESNDKNIRAQALMALISIQNPVSIDILKQTAKDEFVPVRMLTAQALSDKKLGDNEVSDLVSSLIKDKDQKVAAFAIKAATDSRKLTGLVPEISEVLLNSDSSQSYLAVMEAALGLSRLAQADSKEKTTIQEIFVKALAKDYPQTVSDEKVELKRIVTLTALKTLTGYQNDSVYASLLKLSFDSDKDIQTLAIAALAEYKQSTEYLFDKVLKNESFLDRPEMLAIVVERLREYKTDKDFYDAVRQLLDNNKVSQRESGILRVALVEALFDRYENQDVTYLISLMKKDRDWKVRRVILTRLSKNEKILDIASDAIEDTNPVIKQLAVTQAVAATAKKDKSAAYLDKILKSPTPVVCDEIIEAEGLSTDLSIYPVNKIKSIIAERSKNLP
jgi:Ca-activated chloride channel family protein